MDADTFDALVRRFVGSHFSDVTAQQEWIEMLLDAMTVWLGARPTVYRVHNVIEDGPYGHTLAKCGSYGQTDTGGNPVSVEAPKPVRTNEFSICASNSIPCNTAEPDAISIASAILGVVVDEQIVLREVFGLMRLKLVAFEVLANRAGACGNAAGCHTQLELADAFGRVNVHGSPDYGLLRSRGISGRTSYGSNNLWVSSRIYSSVLPFEAAHCY